MSLYTRILVATDFSDINRIAVERAAILAKQNSCQLILLHVIEHFPIDGGPLSSLILLHVIEHFPIDGGPLSSVFKNNAGPDDALAQHVRGRMNELVDSLDCDDIQAEFSITSKSARFEILHFAAEHEVDLIVVAPHGQGIIGTLGSTATGVLNNATCDVLAVRQADKAA